MNGLGRVIIEGCGEISVTPSTLMFFEHGKVRQYYCADEHWDFWWFEFSSSEMLHLPMNSPISIEPMEDEEKDFTACLELLSKAGTGMARLASAAFTVLFSKWLLKIDYYRRDNPYRLAVKSAINRIKSNLDRHIPIKDLAREAGLSERRFRQVFEKTAGMRPKKYEGALRIHLAEELLLNTPCTICEIAERLGYSSLFHFSKAFANAYGLPPSTFRKNGIKP
jgi:AraC-like DNA-binding protein